MPEHNTHPSKQFRPASPDRRFRVPTMTCPPPADVENPHEVSRSHLLKMELGKSSSSCKVSLVTRVHRSCKLQEFWCASFEEACVYENLAAHPDVVNFAEQLTRVDFINDAGEQTHTRVDAHVLLSNGEEVLVSVKYDKKARSHAYVAEVANIARQASRAIADRFIVLSRFSFHPVYRTCAKDIHHARRGWDPEADQFQQSTPVLMLLRLPSQWPCTCPKSCNPSWRAPGKVIIG